MQIEAVGKLSYIDMSLRKRIELWINLIFNLSMYIILLITSCIYVFNDDLDYLFITRLVKASIEFIVAIGLFWSGFALLITVKQLMQAVPKNLMIWLAIGCTSCLVKGGEQFFFYLMENYEGLKDWVYILLLFSYNLDDLLPTIVFLKSFIVYSRFMKNDKESDSIGEFSFHLTESVGSLSNEEKIVI